MRYFFFLIIALGLAILQSCGSKETLVSTETTGTIKGTVVDTNGVTVERVIISSTPPSSQVLTPNDGSFTLPDLVPGVYTVQAEKINVGSGQAAVNVLAGKTTTATIVLTSGPITTGVISGLVTDPSNTVVSGAAISTIPPSKETITDATGHFAMAGIAPGTYSVIAKKDGFQDGSKNASVMAGLTATANIQLGIAGALPTDGLLAYYKLDGDGNDASGNNHPMLITNGFFVSPRTTTGQALSFNSGATATASHDPVFNTSDATISLWIKTSKPSATVWALSHYGGAGTFNGYVLWFNGPDQLVFTYGVNSSNNTFAAISDESIADNAWHSIICTADGSGCRIFFDGVIAVSSGWQGTPGTPTLSKDLRIGDPNDGFHGTIDDVRIYNRVLSGSEIQDLANEK